MEKFETTISDLLEVNNVNLDDELNSFDAWDSLTILGIISFLLDEYKLELSSDEIEECLTIGGLKELVLSKV